LALDRTDSSRPDWRDPRSCGWHGC